MKKRLKGILLFALVLLLAGGVRYVVLPGRRFDPVLWKTAKTCPARFRLRMAADVLDRGRWYGLTRSEVLSLLGEPSETESFKEYDFVYHVGPEPGFWAPIQSGWIESSDKADES